MNETRYDITEIRRRLENSRGQEFWRSLDELADSEEFREFMHKEFPRQAAPLENSLDRRDFLKLLGASLAFAGLTACARPAGPNEKIVPYVRAPEEIVPGKPLFFATAVTTGGFAEGVLAESHQGRPTKLEGNDRHPASLGATHAITQATVLSLYDPDRSQLLTERGQGRTWSDLTAGLAEALGQLDQGAGLAILTETVTSPSLAAQLGALLERYPQARWHQYEPVNRDNALEGSRLAFGQAVMPVYDFGRADVVLSLGADFTNSGPGRLRYAKDFARRRRTRTAEDDMNRLYQVESSPSPTGALADHRVPLAPAAIAAFASRVAHELELESPNADLPAGVEEALLEALVADLEAHRGSSLVLAGEDQPPVVHALAHAMNQALDNVGQTVRYLAPIEAAAEPQLSSLIDLAESMRSGAVQVLLVLGGDPAYSAPADLDFAGALAQVPLSVHLGLYRNRTAALSTWHVPQTHFLETWGDARAYDGTVSLQQPLIAPFYGGRSASELVAAVLGDPGAKAYDLVRSAWRDRVEGDFDAFWRESLYSGIVGGTASPGVDVSVGDFAVELPGAEAGLVLQFQEDPSIGDGRHVNNGWLQELPKPYSKLTWDNAALISPADAEELGVGSHDLVSLDVEGRALQVPVWVQPGQARGTITLHLGYGQEDVGRVGSGVGVNAYAVRTSSAPWHAPVEVRKVQGRYRLATTQTHQSLEGTGERRHIIRAGTLAEFRAHPEHPEFVHPVEHEVADLYPEFEYRSYAWGMVIDMTVCTGCNACITACQAENNVPIVGRDQVLVGREMHWIRVDQYYGGELDDPKVYNMPMACQHCEKAPCEPVCPVGATVHDHEGLNVMVYNRCVGTRYCSNNCPYKVRRFNFLQYAELATGATELSLANNPDVTVRSRGVMEKCTYCTQRISRARIQANNEDRSIADGDVVTACEAACPTEAIVFGDLNDPASRVSTTKGSPLNYALLEELNTVPRTTYLAKVSNPNPELAGEAEVH